MMSRGSPFFSSSNAEMLTLDAYRAFFDLELVIVVGGIGPIHSHARISFTRAERSPILLNKKVILRFLLVDSEM